MQKRVAIIGGGIAGLESSAYLSSIGYKVSLLEKENQLGGHLIDWETLFPTRRKGGEVVDFLMKGIENVDVVMNCNIKDIQVSNHTFSVSFESHPSLEVDAVLLTTGFDLFNARRKEEYGYGIYENVITSAELEKIFSKGELPLTKKGNVPERIGFIHCVGSRDAKAGNIHCSKVCCVTAVKQAVEIRERLPNTEVFCFYMDLRMFGRHFEELFQESQEKWGVNYIRGRLSEASENIDGQIIIKVEDTLLSKPMKISVDILVLMVGFEPSSGTRQIGKILNINFGTDGFLKTQDEHVKANTSNVPGVFLAGTCTGPMTIKNTIADARAAALRVQAYMEGWEINNR